MRYLTFGQKLRVLRKNKKMSQKDLSNSLDIAFSSIARYENDQVLPNTDIMLKIANLFNVSADYLLKEDGFDIQDKELLAIVTKIDQLDQKGRNILKGTILGAVDSYIKNNET